MDQQQLWDYLNKSALVFMAMGGAYLVKVIVNDLKHDVAEIKELLQKVVSLLEKERGRGE